MKIMINLTTSCRKSDTVCFGVVATLAVLLTPLVSAQDNTALKPQPSTISELQPAQALGQSFTITDSDKPQQNQSVEALKSQLNVEPEVLMRGPLHEAFADAFQANPQPNPIVESAPPESINELPPEFRPEGENVQWISGYWAWDEIQSDYIWVSGVWRDVPPGQHWVSGYWEQEEHGYRWVSGFWTRESPQQLNYLPEPPADLEQGPSIAAPDENYFYCPGSWEYRTESYVWRTGYWQPNVENWVWIPPRYVWTPRGCIYRNGYWDYEFNDRGTVFAPVSFSQPIYQSVGFEFRPAYCVNTGADFLVHMFVRSNGNHYFYGDWYGANQLPTPYRPWINQQSHYRNYDPLLAHYGCSRYRHDGVQLLTWVNNQHRYYASHREVRPGVTLNVHIRTKSSGHDHQQNDYLRRATLADRYVNNGRQPQGSHGNRPPSELNGSRPVRNHIRVDEDDQRRTDSLQKHNREIAELRRQSERNQNIRSSDRIGPDHLPGKGPLTRRPGGVSKQNSEEKKIRQQSAFREPRNSETDGNANDRNNGNRDNPRALASQPNLSVIRTELEESRQRASGKEARREQPPSERSQIPRNRLTDQRARDAVSRARITQQTNEQSRLETQRQQALRHQGELKRTQVVEKPESGLQAGREKENMQKEAKARESRQQQEAARRAKEAQVVRDNGVREAQAKAARDNAAREAKSREFRQQQEAARRAKEAQVVRDNVVREAQAKAALDNAAREAKSREFRQQQEAARRAKEAQVVRDNAAREAQAKAALDNAAREAKSRESRQQQELARRARDEQIQAARDKAAREAQANAVRAKLDQVRRAQQQAKMANDKAQREAQNRAREQQRRTDQARRAQEDQQRKAAEQQKQQQRRKEQEARKGKKK